MATITNAQAIMTKLVKNGFEAYFVGGSVRDNILGFDPKDYDVFTNATGQQILNIFPQGTVIGSKERQDKILTVIIDGIEVSSFRANGERTQTGTSLLTHLSTCDFDINSIAEDVNGKRIDPNNGIQALRDGEFGYVGEPKERITEDPLRILRAVRFMFKLNLSFRHMGTFKEFGYLIGNLPKERIREEFMKIISYDGGLERLISTGLIKYILPKFMENIGVDGGQHHAETVDVHLVTAFNIARQLTQDKRIWLAALLHDIAKAQTRTEDELEGEDGNVTEVHFHKHEDIGADYAKQWMTEMKFSNEEIVYVECLIRNHMWQYSQTLTKRSFINHFKSFEVAGVTVFDYVMLKYCDNQANQANQRIKFGDFVSNSPLIQKYYQLKFSKEPFKVSDLVVKGQDLIDLGFTPGKTMGEILQKLYDLVLDGDMPNERAPLLHYVKTECL